MKFLKEPDFEAVQAAKKDLLKLLFDFGLVILIWMTQLIVYPSFSAFSEGDLLDWHSVYTFRISVIVIPLMFGQLGIHILSILKEVTFWKSISLVLIVLAWANTFFFAVPLHNQLSMGVDVLNAADQLVSVNAYRTAFWTFVFGIDLYIALKK